MQPLKNLTPPDYETRLRDLATLFVESPNMLKGCDKEELAAAEQRLGFKLPEPLRQFYLTLGQVEPAMEGFHPFAPLDEIVNYTGTEEDMHSDLSAEQLLALKGDLVFASENQGCWFARYHEDTGEVYLDEMTEDAEHPDDKTHYHATNDLQEAILWILANQGLNINLDVCEIFVNAAQTSGFLDDLGKFFCAYTSNVDEKMGNVFFNPELAMVIIGGTMDDGSFHGYLFTDNSLEEEEDDDSDEDEDDNEDESGKLAEFSHTFPQVELSYM